MATTRLLLIEKHIRWLQLCINIVAFFYLAFTWGDRVDRNAIARGDVDFGRAEGIAEQNSSGHIEPNSSGDVEVEQKSLHQRRLAADGNQ